MVTNFVYTITILFNHTILFKPYHFVHTKENPKEIKLPPKCLTLSLPSLFCRWSSLPVRSLLFFFLSLLGGILRLVMHYDSLQALNTSVRITLSKQIVVEEYKNLTPNIYKNNYPLIRMSRCLKNNF